MFPPAQVIFLIPFVPSVYTHPCLLYIMVPALRGSRHLLIQNLEEIPTNPRGSRSAAPKTQRLCKSARPAFIYPRFPFAPRETRIVPCVAIIACNLHRIRTGNSALISNKAGESLHRLSSYLTAQQNYRFSCGVLNLQGVFLFLPRGEHYLLQMLLVYLPCLFYNPTPAAPFPRKLHLQLG